MSILSDLSCSLTIILSFCNLKSLNFANTLAKTIIKILQTPHHLVPEMQTALILNQN